MKMEREIRGALRGAAAVAQITEIPDWEAELILNLRLWQDGECGQRAVWTTYARALGPRDGRRALDTFAGLVFAIETNMLRPLVRHDVACPYIGSDEAVFANLVRMASAGELHEATLIATLMVRPAQAELIALMAADVGSTLHTIVSPRDPPRPAPHRPMRKYH